MIIDCHEFVRYRGCHDRETSLKSHIKENELGHLEARVGGVGPIFEVALDLAPRRSRRSASSLLQQLRAAIADGRIAAGTKLPASRAAGKFFAVSRNTLASVYEQLIGEGLVVSRPGAGTYAAGIAQSRPAAPQSVVAHRDARLNPFWLREDVTAALNFWNDPPERPSASGAGVANVDLRPAMVDSRLFPLDVLRRMLAKPLRALERKPASLQSPRGNQGNHGLRQAICAHIALTRAVVCDPSDILVTSGAQQAFDLLARTLVTSPRTKVAIEDPGYPPMRVAFAAAGAELVPVAVDDEGLLVDALPSDIAVICVCPSHQFPLGVAMSPRRRSALVAFARLHGAVIVEDDYDGEFRLHGSPLEALRAAKEADLVFYVGTFSKCMLPSLRLGFIVAPAWAMPTLVAAKNAQDWHCPWALQAGVAAFITEGHLSRHVRKMREIYKKRRQALLSALESEVSTWLTPLSSSYGMHVTAVARAALNFDEVAETLATRGVRLHSLGRYHAGKRGREGLVFGYGVADGPDLVKAIHLLRETLASY